MKIVINAYSARMGGGQTYLINLLSHIPERKNFEVLVFAPPSLKLPVHPQIKRIYSSWPTTNPLLRALWERFLLPIFLRRERADILFCPGGVIATPVPPGCKTVTMFRNMIPFDAPLVESMPWGFQRIRNLILKRAMLQSMSRASLTIFISDHARGVIEKLIRIPNPITIPHGISNVFRSFGSALQRPSKAPAEEYILYVSRFDVYKHHREIIEAFAALDEKLTRDLRLVFLGEMDMPEIEPVRNLVKKLDLAKKVLMLGAVPYENLPAWYQHARLIIFASSCENCPNILLESMASGRPVVSSNVMPMPEFGGENLIYFSPFNPLDISMALSKVLSDSVTETKLAEAALLQSLKYDWKQASNKTWEKIMELIEG
jgi:glycosyltransferase involved in cell wall biosynthesis